MRVLIPPNSGDADTDLLRISSENPGFQVERDAAGNVVMSPTNTAGGAKSGEAHGQLYLYAKRVGGKAFDADTGFAIGPGAEVRAPDASWVSRARIDALTDEERAVFWPISPDVAIEVRSPSDRFETVVAKIEHYIERGTQYAVAIDPQTRAVVERGTPPAGLTLDFDAIIDA